jgi:hypothetical protein
VHALAATVTGRSVIQYQLTPRMLRPPIGGHPGRWVGKKSACHRLGGGPCGVRTPIAVTEMSMRVRAVAGEPRRGLEHRYVEHHGLAARRPGTIGRHHPEGRWEARHYLARRGGSNLARLHVPQRGASSVARAKFALGVQRDWVRTRCWVGAA